VALLVAEGTTRVRLAVVTSSDGRKKPIPLEVPGASRAKAVRVLPVNNGCFYGLLAAIADPSSEWNPESTLCGVEYGQRRREEPGSVRWLVRAYLSIAQGAPSGDLL
jgi:hypothetical protein